MYIYNSLHMLSCHFSGGLNLKSIQYILCLICFLQNLPIINHLVFLASMLVAIFVISACVQEIVHWRLFRSKCFRCIYNWDGLKFSWPTLSSVLAFHTSSWLLSGPRPRLSSWPSPLWSLLPALSSSHEGSAISPHLSTLSCHDNVYFISLLHLSSQSSLTHDPFKALRGKE